MSGRISFVTIAVDDLDTSLSFYRQWMELADEAISTGDDHAALTMEDGFSLVLYPRAKIAEAAGQPAGASSSEFILSREVASAEEFASIIEGAVAAGGKSPDHRSRKIGVGGASSPIPKAIYGRSCCSVRPRACDVEMEAPVLSSAGCIRRSSGRMRCRPSHKLARASGAQTFRHRL